MQSKRHPVTATKNLNKPDTRTPAPKSALRVLDLDTLKQVAGGSPKGTWSADLVQSPKGTW